MLKSKMKSYLQVEPTTTCPKSLAKAFGSPIRVMNPNHDDFSKIVTYMILKRQNNDLLRFLTFTSMILTTIASFWFAFSIMFIPYVVCSMVVLCELVYLFSLIKDDENTTQWKYFLKYISKK